MRVHLRIPEGRIACDSWESGSGDFATWYAFSVTCTACREGDEWSPTMASPARHGHQDPTILCGECPEILNSHTVQALMAGREGLQDALVILRGERDAARADLAAIQAVLSAPPSPPTYTDRGTDTVMSRALQSSDVGSHVQVYSSLPDGVYPLVAGRIVAMSDGPCALVERADGFRVMVGLNSRWEPSTPPPPAPLDTETQP